MYLKNLKLGLLSLGTRFATVEQHDHAPSWECSSTCAIPRDIVHMRDSVGSQEMSWFFADSGEYCDVAQINALLRAARAQEAMKFAKLVEERHKQVEAAKLAPAQERCTSLVPGHGAGSGKTMSVVTDDELKDAAQELEQLRTELRGRIAKLTAHQSERQSEADRLAQVVEAVESWTAPAATTTQEAEWSATAEDCIAAGHKVQFRGYMNYLDPRPVPPEAAK